MKKNNRKGFTIVELVIVIAVIAILAAVLIPTFGGIVKKAQENAALQEIQNAYKDAYAIALSNDGAINDNDDDVTEVKEGTPEVLTGYKLTGSKYIFTFDTTGKLTGAAETAESPEFVYTVTNGVITAVAKQK
jgi:type IV pilus assembly protein PilA